LRELRDDLTLKRELHRLDSFRSYHFSDLDGRPVSEYCVSVGETVLKHLYENSEKLPYTFYEGNKRGLIIHYYPLTLIIHECQIAINSNGVMKLFYPEQLAELLEYLTEVFLEKDIE